MLDRQRLPMKTSVAAIAGGKFTAHLSIHKIPTRTFFGPFAGDIAILGNVTDPRGSAEELVASRLQLLKSPPEKNSS